MASLESIAEACEERVRASPVQAAGVALAGAYVVSRLPLGEIAGVLARVVFSLIRPALFVLGAMKICDLIRGRGERPPGNVAREYL